MSSPPASVSPDPSSITIAGRDASNTSITCKHRGKSRSKQGKDDKNSCGKRISDLSLQGCVVSAPVGKNLNRPGHERTLHIQGTGKILQGKSETNGNYVTIHPSKNIQEAHREDGFKLAKKRRPVTVDTAKAKTSLEALKLSIKQLKWKEVCYVRVSVLFFCCLSWRNAIHQCAVQVLFLLNTESGFI